MNIANSAKEMHEKKISYSASAADEVRVMTDAVLEIVSLTIAAFVDNNIENATRVEPLEEVIDMLQTEIRTNHIIRLKNNECTIELGFILTDMLTDLERVSDHCSNIAGCIIEITHKSLGMHGYIRSLKSGNEVYDEYLSDYSRKYKISI